jgi:hypothetical protein
LDPGAVIYEPSCNGAFRQAEVLSAVLQLKRTVSSESTQITVDLVSHPFAIIVSQDCDLDLDFRARNGLIGPDDKPVGPEKRIPNILLCELVTAEELSSSGRLSGEINSTIWSRIRTNEHVRYHFFQAVGADLDAVGSGLPELAADFKRYFTVVADDLYAQLQESVTQDLRPIQRRLRLKSPYCEHFSTRFSFYLSRVALPEPHLSI